MAEIEKVKEVIAVCNEFMASKILFADRKIRKILEAIAKSPDVYNLIAECMNAFNREKELEKAFVSSNTGESTFIMPKDEVKQISLAFCILVDIDSRKISFDELVSKFFLNEDGHKDYSLFMQKIILPFRNLIAEAFGISPNITTEESVNEMKKGIVDDIEEDDKENFQIQKREFADLENLQRTFELSRNIAIEIRKILLGEKKRTADITDGIEVINSIVEACSNENFDCLYSLVLGLKRIVSGVKSSRFLLKELVDLINTQLLED